MSYLSQRVYTHNGEAKAHLLIAKGFALLRELSEVGAKREYEVPRRRSGSGRVELLPSRHRELATEFARTNPFYATG